MIGRLIKQLFGESDSSYSHRSAIADVQDKKIASGLIPAKFKADVERLQELYKKEFVAGLSINWTLQQALEILPKDRQRVDSYNALAKYLKNERGIELTIKSNKTR
ncbi:MAG: hypothetical protein SNH07_00490 [Rikenellaceae bacterium]